MGDLSKIIDQYWDIINIVLICVGSLLLLAITHFMVAHLLDIRRRKYVKGLRMVYDHDVELVEDVKKIMRKIEVKRHLQTKWIHNTLLLSMMKNGTLKVVYEQVEVWGMLSGIIEQSKRVVNHDDTRIMVVCDVQVKNLVIHTDRQMIKTLLGNAINNALKYTCFGEVRVGGFVDGKDLVLYVQDTGIGLSDEQVHMLFNSFIQIDQFTENSGLGIPLMIEAARLLDGYLGVYSRLGLGSTVYFRLPVVENGEQIAHQMIDSVVYQQMKRAIWVDGDRQ